MRAWLELYASGFQGHDQEGAYKLARVGGRPACSFGRSSWRGWVAALPALFMPIREQCFYQEIWVGEAGVRSCHSAVGTALL